MPSTCDPGFKKVNGGSLFNFSFSMDPAASKLKVILKGVDFTEKDDLMASWIIFIPILAVFLIVGGLFLVCFIRQRKAKRARAASTSVHLFWRCVYKSHWQVQWHFEVDSNIDQGKVGADDKKILKLRDQIMGVKAIARSVFRFTLKGNKDALFPWSFQSIKEFGSLTNEQIDSVLTICPLTSRQQAKIRLGYRDLWKQSDRQAKQKYSAEQLTIATLKKNHEVR